MATFRACPACGEHFPPATRFCTSCGASVADAPLQSQYGGTQHFWTIPDYLQQASRWQRAVDTGAGGSGLAWIGTLLVAVPFLGDPSARSSIAAYVAGLALIVTGLVRMRSSARTLARAGMVANGVALIALGAIAFQVVRAETDNTPSAPAAITVQDAESAGATDTLPLSGETTMFRGDAAHTGVLGGPAPTGEPTLAWRYDAGGEITSSAATANGLIYITSKRGDLLAIDAASGDLRWQANLGEYVLKSSPALFGDSVIAAGGYALYAFDATTGEERWRQPIQYAAQSSPVITGTLALIASQDGRLYAIDAASGSQLWVYSTEGLIFGSPAVSNGVAFIGSDDGIVHALSLERGTLIWKEQTPGGIAASPAVANNLVVIEGRSGVLIALDTAHGIEQWRYGIGGESSVAISGNLVIAGGADGGVHAVDLTTGEAIWLFPTGNPVISSPVVVENTVYLASGLNLFAIDLATGQGIWRFSTTDTIEASPAIANGQIYLGSRDGFLYAIGGTDERAEG